MEPWLKLHSSTLVLYLKLDHYKRSQEWGVDWVNVRLRITGAGLDIDWYENDLLVNEIDDIYSKLINLLNNENFDDHLETIEEDYSFGFYSDSDIKHLKLNFYLDMGSQNKLVLYLSGLDLIRLKWYLRLIMHKVKRNYPVIDEYYKNGFLQG